MVPRMALQYGIELGRCRRAIDLWLASAEKR
jgi:hypothetical protein